MVKRRMVIALVVAVLSSTASFIYLVHGSGSEEVVVAGVDIAACSLIEPGSVRLARVDRSAAHPDAFRRLEEVCGNYSTQPLVAGEQVLRRRVAAGEQGGVVSGLAGDMRAMFVPVDESRAVGGVLKQGGRVDVVFVSAEQHGASVAKRLLTSVQVIQAGTGQKGAGGRDGGGGVSGVIVAVTPADAERLAFCLENGSIYLVAVPYGSPPSATAGVTWKDVFLADAPASQ
ncbi:MAG: Flp pilus assembly protein CpaB [Ignavibacteriales bacterium]